MKDFKQLADKMTQLKEQRKSGEIGVKEFYTGLLDLLSSLSASLTNELDKINEADVRGQIPLMLVFLDDQIRSFGSRE